MNRIIQITFETTGVFYVYDIVQRQVYIVRDIHNAKPFTSQDELYSALGIIGCRWSFIGINESLKLPKDMLVGINFLDVSGIK